MIFSTKSGVDIELISFFEMDRGIMFTGKIVGIPEGPNAIESQKLSAMLRAETLFGRPILGVEMFARYTQCVGFSVGLLVQKAEV